MTMRVGARSACKGLSNFLKRSILDRFLWNMHQLLDGHQQVELTYFHADSGEARAARKVGVRFAVDLFMDGSLSLSLGCKGYSLPSFSGQFLVFESMRTLIGPKFTFESAYFLSGSGLARSAYAWPAAAKYARVNDTWTKGMNRTCHRETTSLRRRKARQRGLDDLLLFARSRGGRLYKQWAKSIWRFWIIIFLGMSDWRGRGRKRWKRRMIGWQRRDHLDNSGLIQFCGLARLGLGWRDPSASAHMASQRMYPKIDACHQPGFIAGILPEKPCLIPIQHFWISEIQVLHLP